MWGFPPWQGQAGYEKEICSQAETVGVPAISSTHPAPACLMPQDLLPNIAVVETLAAKAPE
jgi:hypothetical protein